MTKSKLISAAEAALELGISKRRVNALIAAGRLKAEQIGGVHVIRFSDLDAVRVRDRRGGRPPADPNNPSPAALAKRRSRERLKSKG